MLKIQEHRIEYRIQFDLVSPLADIVVRLGGHLGLELPRGCDYWYEEPLQEHVNKHALALVPVDGCINGLTARFGEETGKLLLKPWLNAFISQMRADSGTHMSAQLPPVVRLPARALCTRLLRPPCFAAPAACAPTENAETKNQGYTHHVAVMRRTGPSVGLRWLRRC